MAFNAAAEFLEIAAAQPDLAPALLAAVEAAVAARAVAGPVSGTAATLRRFRVLSDTESDALPPPAWLVEGILLQNAVNVLYGPGGVGKSFLAVDLALTLAAGLASWYGRAAAPGPVVYIGAEAPEEVSQRKRAWKADRQVPATPAFFLIPERVPLLDPAAVPDLLASLPPAAARPALIVIDTLARTMRGGDENGTRDMGRVFEAAEQLKDATGAAILIVAHSGKDASRGARGSSVLTFDARQSLVVAQDDGVITLAVEKHNTSGEQLPLRFVLRPSLDTMVLAPAAAGHLSAGNIVTPRQLTLLEALAGPTFSYGARWGELRDATGYNGMTFKRSLDALLTRGDVRQDGPPHTKDTRYYITEQGRALVEPPVAVAPAPAAEAGTVTRVTRVTSTVTHSNSDSASHSNTVTAVTSPLRGVTAVTVTLDAPVTAEEAAEEIAPTPSAALIEAPVAPVAPITAPVAPVAPVAAPDPADVWQASGPRGQAPPVGICDQPGHQVQYYRRTVWKCRTCAVAAAEKEHAPAPLA